MTDASIPDPIERQDWERDFEPLAPDIRQRIREINRAALPPSQASVTERLSESIRKIYPELPPTEADLEGAKTLKIKIPFFKTRRWEFNFSFERTARKKT
jgi:hypothetical protein